MTESSTKSAPPSPWWKRILEYATPKMPSFRFMVHDQWANVLFLHWKIPEHLEATLEANTAPFVIERYNGSAWIGLILLTEENVGPSICRSQWTCLTHHGINVRTYVKGIDCNGSDEPPMERGIHFSSLECDDEFTSFGANFFGMPYRLAEMKRSYSSSVQEAGEQTKELSTAHRSYYKMRSERLASASPSFLRIMFHSLNWWRMPRLLYSTETKDNPSGSISKAIDKTERSSSSSEQRFTVDCSWSRVCSNENNSNHSYASNEEKVFNTLPSDEPFGEWATERYFVYTQKYGRNWRGQVDHEPWPLDPSTVITLDSLTISGVDAYEPKSMRPILRHMSLHRPDHVGFSEGVGPVTFTMLQPV